MKNWICWPMLQLRGFWQDRNERKNGAQLVGARVSFFLSHRIVKSLTFMVSSKLKIQCTRNGLRNLPYCPGSIQYTFIFPRNLTTSFSKNIPQRRAISKIENPVHWQNKLQFRLLSVPGQQWFVFWISIFLISEIFSCNIFWGNLVIRSRGKMIKVFWIDLWQNGGFWGPFLVHWSSNLP